MKKSLTRDKLIALLRNRQGSKSQEAFAAELGITQPHLSDIYRGKRDPGPEVLGKLGLSKVIIYQEAEPQ